MKINKHGKLIEHKKNNNILVQEPSEYHKSLLAEFEIEFEKLYEGGYTAEGIKNMQLEIQDLKAADFFESSPNDFFTPNMVFIGFCVIKNFNARWIISDGKLMIELQINNSLHVMDIDTYIIVYFATIKNDSNFLNTFFEDVRLLTKRKMTPGIFMKKYS